MHSENKNDEAAIVVKPSSYLKSTREYSVCFFHLGVGSSLIPIVKYLHRLQLWDLDPSSLVVFPIKVPTDMREN